jgi:hypothetical protein
MYTNISTVYLATPSHIGIHLSWLQLISSLLISCKIIYVIAKLSIDYYQKSKLQKA